MTNVELYDTFFTKIQIQKMMVWDNLQTGNTTLDILKTKLNISKRQLKSIIVNLDEELKNEICEGTVLLQIYNDRIKIINFNVSEYVILKNKLRYRYLLESGIFNLLLYIFEKRSFSIKELTDVFFYSESYMYKLLNKLDVFLYSLDRGIRLKKGKGAIYLSGEESIIRIIHYIAIRKVSMGHIWLFKTITEEDVGLQQSFVNYKAYRNFSPTIKSKSDILFAIYDNAVRRGYFLDSLDNEVINLGKIISEKSNSSLSFTYLKERNVTDREGKLHSEYIHFAFLSDFFLQDMKSQKEKVLIGEYIKLHSAKSSIAKDCIELLNEIREHYKIPDHIYYSLIYSLCNRFVVIHHFQLYKIIFLSEDTGPVTKMESIVGNCFEKVFSLYSECSSFVSIKDSFIHVITGYLQIYLPIKLKIYVDFIYRSEYKYKIENAILRNYNSDIIELTNNYSEANIIISDTFLYEPVKYFFYFEDMFDPNSWTKLGSYLNQVIEDEILKNT